MRPVRLDGREIAERVTQLAHAQGITPKQLCRKAMLSSGGVVSKAKREGRIGVAAVQALARALDVSVRVLTQDPE